MPFLQIVCPLDWKKKHKVPPGLRFADTHRNDDAVDTLFKTDITVRIFLFREYFRLDAAISSFVYLRFGRSRFLCRYERARSPIPMLRSGMRAPRPPQHAQRQKNAHVGGPGSIARSLYARSE